MAAGNERIPLSFATAGRGLADMLASALRGSVKSALGAPGDLEALLRGREGVLPSSEKVGSMLPAVNPGSKESIYEDIGGFLPTPSTGLEMATLLPAVLRIPEISKKIGSNVALANILKKKGAGPNDIWDQAKVFEYPGQVSGGNAFAPGAQWGFEIPDGQFTFPGDGEAAKLGDVYHSPELYDLLPALKDIDWQQGGKPRQPFVNANAHYDSNVTGTPQIAMNIESSNFKNQPIAQRLARMKRTGEHEINHAINDLTDQLANTGYNGHNISFYAEPMIRELADSFDSKKPELAKMLRSIRLADLDDPNHAAAMRNKNWDLSTGEQLAEEAAKRGAMDKMMRDVLRPEFPGFMIPDNLTRMLGTNLYDFGRTDKNYVTAADAPDLFKKLRSNLNRY